MSVNYVTQTTCSLCTCHHVSTTNSLLWCNGWMQALRPGAATALDATTLEAVAGDAPSASLAASQVVGVTVAELLVTCKLQPSKGAARKCVVPRLLSARVLRLPAHLLTIYTPWRYCEA